MPKKGKNIRKGGFDSYDNNMYNQFGMDSGFGIGTGIGTGMMPGQQQNTEKFLNISTELEDNPNKPWHIRIYNFLIRMAILLKNITVKELKDGKTIDSFINLTEQVNVTKKTNTTSGMPGTGMGYGIDMGMGSGMGYGMDMGMGTGMGTGMDMGMGMGTTQQRSNKTTIKLLDVNTWKYKRIWFIIFIFIYIIPISIFIVSFIRFLMVISNILVYIKEPSYFKDKLIYNDVNSIIKIKTYIGNDIYINYYILLLTIIIFIALIIIFIMYFFIKRFIKVDDVIFKKYSYNIYYLLTGCIIVLIIYYIYWNSIQTIGSSKNELDEIVNKHINLHYLKYILKSNNDINNIDVNSNMLLDKYKNLYIYNNETKLQNYIKGLLSEMKNNNISISQIDLIKFKDIKRPTTDNDKYYDLILNAIFTYLIIDKLNRNKIYIINNTTFVNTYDFFESKKSLFLTIGINNPEIIENIDLYKNTLFNFNVDDTDKMLLNISNFDYLLNGNNKSIDDEPNCIKNIYTSINNKIGNITNIINQNFILPEYFYQILILIIYFIYVNISISDVNAELSQGMPLQNMQNTGMGMGMGNMY